jgi:hypothetical protein
LIVARTRSETPNSWRTLRSAALPQGGGSIEKNADLSLGLFEATNAIASFDWDLETVRPLHRRLKEAMKGELAAISAFDAGDRGLAA